MILRLKHIFKSYGKIISLGLALGLGMLLPGLHTWAFLVRYLLMVMLFFAFLDLQVELEMIKHDVWRVLLANLVIAFLGYAFFSLFNHDMALTAFLTGIAPTATASSVLVSFVRGKVSFMLAAVLLTNVVVALVIPFALPLVLGEHMQISVWQVLQPVLAVMFIPLFAAWLARLLKPDYLAVVRRGKKYNFSLWLLVLLIVSANASYFLRTEYHGSMQTLAWIALTALLVCIVNFGTGALIATPAYRLESSQALGQKNITFIIWIALTYISPLAAMGPTFYILYHNLYNSWQIYQFEKRNLVSSQ